MRNLKNSAVNMDSATTVRQSVSEIVLVSIVIAIGVNLLTNADFATSKGFILLFIGLSALIFAVIVISKRAIPRVNKTYVIKGVIIISNKSHKIIKVPRYNLADNIKESLDGLFLENNAIRNLWNNSKLDGVSTYENQSEFAALPVRNKLIIEAIEYYVLEKLSSHLSAYFEAGGADNKISPDKIVTLSRSDIPTVLLSNRFLELFTRPMEERDAFQRSKSEDNGLFYITRVKAGDEDGTIVSARSADGAVFEHFELILPAKTSITRKSNNTINIKNSKFDINIKPIFEGWHDNLGLYFDRLYLDEDFKEIDVYKCSVEISVKFPFFTLMRSSGWEYLYWIESWINKMEGEVCFEKFKELIGWEHSLTSAIINRNIHKNRRLDNTSASNKQNSAEEAVENLE